jgi:hypothetical protein
MQTIETHGLPPEHLRDGRCGRMASLSAGIVDAVVHYPLFQLPILQRCRKIHKERRIVPVARHGTAAMPA